MEKISNFKAHFSKILKDKYSLNREDIKEYWANKEQEENYDNKRHLITSASVGGVTSSLCFAIWDVCNGADCVLPIIVATGVSALVGVVSLVKINPYEKEEYEEIDEDYVEEKEKFKTKTKRK